MFGLIIAGIAAVGAAVLISCNEERENYFKELESAKSGKTILRENESTVDTVEICTFSTEQEAIKYPQEITFDPNSYSWKNRETVLLLRCPKKSVEIYDGKEFKKVFDSGIIKVNSGYVYLRFKEHPLD